MKILLIDNNDSFTYNIVEMLRQIGVNELSVISSNEITCQEVADYDKIIFSPGPMLPCDYPIMFEILDIYGGVKPILGICLGHQAICQYYGAKLINLSSVLHGVSSDIVCDPNSHLFKNMETTTVGRYHSWVAENVSQELVVTASDDDGFIMAVEHINKPIYGVQFHPESYISCDGKSILKRFIYE